MSNDFSQVLREMDALHLLKQQDYGREYDPFANVRASEDFGVKPWVGALIRANDKMRRLMKAASGGTLVNESVEDSMLDLAVYALISLILFRESNGTDRSEHHPSEEAEGSQEGI
jgi:hypothetical protein